MGKLAVDGQNINYFVRLEENVQKPSKIAEFRKRSDFDSFFDDFFKLSTINEIPTTYRQLTRR